VRSLADTEADEESEEDAHDTGRGVKEGRNRT
jgi:hypothetical protein